jgi:HemY protein
MTRIALSLFLLSGLIVGVVSLLGEPGAASLTWLGWQVDTTAAAAALLIGLLALVATAFWRALIWILAAPERNRRAAAETRRRQGREVLTRGFLAAAAGDGAGARRLAQRAAEFAEEAPQLTRLLSAQAAETAGDLVAARAAYSGMLGLADMRLTAHRGLMRTALAQADRAEALRHAAAAFALDGAGPWAWRALLEARLESGDWAGAIQLVQEALARRVVSPAIADRARVALQAASAAGLEGATPGAPVDERAVEFAQAAARARPDFAPAAVIAARLLCASGRGARAAPLIEAAWRARPHPALWLAWRDLRTDETPRERAHRLGALAALRPDDRESRILAVEQALIVGDLAAARTGVADLESEPTTRRLAALHVRVAVPSGLTDEARAWIVRGADAPREADWSDIDASGRAFPYDAADWARVVAAYAETGELIHPRLERREPTLGDLPRAPMGYEGSAPFVTHPFIAAVESGDPLPPIIDDSDFGDALQATAGEAVSDSRGFRALGARAKGR